MVCLGPFVVVSSSPDITHEVHGLECYERLVQPSILFSERAVETNCTTLFTLVRKFSLPVPDYKPTLNHSDVVLAGSIGR